MRHASAQRASAQHTGLIAGPTTSRPLSEAATSRTRRNPVATGRPPSPGITTKSERARRTYWGRIASPFDPCPGECCGQVIRRTGPAEIYLETTSPPGTETRRVRLRGPDPDRSMLGLTGRGLHRLGQVLRGAGVPCRLDLGATSVAMLSSMLASKRLRSLGWRRRWLARLLEPRVSPICAWCDFRVQGPAGQLSVRRSPTGRGWRPTAPRMSSAGLAERGCGLPTHHW